MVNNSMVVATLGRSGSTLLYKSIVESMGYNSGLSHFEQNLQDCKYEQYAVYKTHDFPPDNVPEHVKFIWTFADPYEIVISVMMQKDKKGIDWVKGHFGNMNGEFDRFDDILEYDALHLNEHFDKWYGEQNFDLLTVKYKSMWDYQKQLSQFVGSYVDLPIFRDRGKRFDRLDDEQQGKMVDAYGELHKKIEEAEDFKIW